MADPVASQQVQQIAAEWEKLVSSQLAHVESFFAELAKLETKGVAQLLGAWDEAGRAAKDSLAQAEKVAGEWRKFGLEAARRTAQFVTPKPTA